MNTGTMSPDGKLRVYANANGLCWLAGVCKEEATHWWNWQGTILRKIAVCQVHAQKSILSNNVDPERYWIEPLTDTNGPEEEEWA